MFRFSLVTANKINQWNIQWMHLEMATLINWILHILFNSNITLYFEHHIQITMLIADKPTLIIHQYPQVILKTYLFIHIFLKHFQKKTIFFSFWWTFHWFQATPCFFLNNFLMLLGQSEVGHSPGGGTWVFFELVCAARDSTLAPRSKKNFP